jgi:adenine deaminase
MLESATGAPLSLYVMASSCVPATTMETSGAALGAGDLATFRADPRVLGLAEVMNFPGVVAGDREVLDKIRLFAGGIVDGHAPRLSGRGLQAYVAAGIGSDHECTTAEEALEKVRLGMTVFVREGTVARNLAALLPAVTPANHHRFCFCTDDCQPADILDRGHVDHLVRLAIAQGLDPVLAIRMATVNAASYFRLHDRGAIAPGRRADLIAFDDLRAPRPHTVIRGGRLAARDGRMLDARPPDPARQLRPTMNVAWDQVDFAIQAEGRRARVIGAVPGSLVTGHLVREVASRDGLAPADPGSDLLKIAVIERHAGSGRMGKGFVSGVGLRRGALASSVAHDHHNLVVIGADDASMRTAARRVIDLGGGMAAAEGERVLAEVPLAIAGLMSAEPVETVRRRVDEAIAAAHRLGSALHDPFMAMSFFGLEVIPSLKLTDHGLVDVDAFRVVPLWAG